MPSQPVLLVQPIIERDLPAIPALKEALVNRTLDSPENVVAAHHQSIQPSIASSVDAGQPASSVLTIEYPPRQQTSTNRGSATVPAASECETGSVADTAVQQGRIQPVLEFGMIAFAGSSCTSIASAALQSQPVPPLRAILSACAVVGFVGTAFAIAAMLLSVVDRHSGARRALWLSSACAVISAVGMIAGTQFWVVTILTVVGMALMLGVVMCPSKAPNKTIEDVEAAQTGHEEG